MTEQFFFDSFFTDDNDAGVPVEVESNGKTITIYLNRSLSLSDKAAAKRKAVRTKINADGSMKILGVDEEAFAIEILTRNIRSWPFQYRDGSPVPVNRETVSKLDASIAEQLQAILLKMEQRQKEEVLDPFVSPSGED